MVDNGAGLRVIGSLMNSATLSANGGSGLTVTGSLINQGALSTNGGSGLTVGGSISNQGMLWAGNDGGISISGDLTIDGLGILAGQALGSIEVYGNLLGDTRNADLYLPQADVLLDGQGTEATPQLLEVMSRDAGLDSGGFTHNFAYGMLELGDNTYVRLVDQSENATGTDPEALYVNALCRATRDNAGSERHPSVRPFG